MQGEVGSGYDYHSKPAMGHSIATGTDPQNGVGVQGGFNEADSNDNSEKMNDMGVMEAQISGTISAHWHTRG